MNNKILSIVIPVYNVEHYIRKCLDSLLVDEKQMNLLDIIVINDGTPDNSAIIAREYEALYPNAIRVLDQENRGHGGAWNHGTELAMGKFLFYLDSDDWVDTEQFAKLIDYLQTCNTDMVLLDRMKYYAYENRYEIEIHRSLSPEHIYDANTFDWFGSGEGSNITYAHNTVYRTEMMQKYMPLFCEHVMYDDVSLQVIPIAIATNFVYTKLNVYRYFIGRPGQSFDPAVRAKHGDHVTIVLKFVMKWITEYRNEVPAGTTRRIWVEDHYSAFCTHHYYELSEFSYHYSKSRLAEWDKYILENYPDITLTRLVKRYRAVPFPAYFVLFKMGRFAKRAIRKMKRMINKTK